MNFDDEEKLRRSLANRPGRSAYDVGYGKPPMDTRFQKGTSGNPRGRPKGRSNKPKQPALNEERMKAIIMEEAYRTIKVNDGGGQTSVPMAQAVIRSLAVNAAKGNQRAQRLFTELLSATERDNKRAYNEYLDVMIAYKHEWEQELARRKQLGITGEDPVPHPDHIVFDMENGTVTINGPVTKEEKMRYDRYLHLCFKKRNECAADLITLRKILAEEPNHKMREYILGRISDTEKLLRMVMRAIPEDQRLKGDFKC